MTQLILDVGGMAIALPESQKGGYLALEEDLSVEITMVTGRLVKELRGVVWRVSYQYGYFNDADRARIITACRNGRRSPIICSFLTPESEEMQTSEFFVTSFSEPKFMWSADGKPMWADFSLELREVNSHRPPSVFRGK